MFGAEAELQAIARLDAAGLPTLSVAAWGVSRDLLPTRRRSFLVTRAVEHEETLEDRARAPLLEPGERRDRIRALAGLVRRMHDAGVNHRDLYLVHVLLCSDELRLIDLHRAQVRGAVPRRWRAKDLAALAFSARATGALGPADERRFVACYARGALRRDEDFWRDVERRAARMAQRGAQDLSQEVKERVALQWNNVLPLWNSRSCIIALVQDVCMVSELRCPCVHTIENHCACKAG